MIKYLSNQNEIEVVTSYKPQKSGKICLEVDIDNLKTEYQYFFEFSCPKNRKYISEKIDFSSGIGIVELPWQVDMYIGEVFLQLIIYSGNEIVGKSFISKQPILIITPSINATEYAKEREGKDFFTKAVETLQDVIDFRKKLEQDAQDGVFKGDKGDMPDISPLIDIAQNINEEMIYIKEYCNQLIESKFMDVFTNGSKILDILTRLDSELSKNESVSTQILSTMADHEKMLENTIKNREIIQTMNTFSDRKIYLNSLDDVLQGANNRFNVKGALYMINESGMQYPIKDEKKEYPWVDGPKVRELNEKEINVLFDGNFETRIKIPKGTYMKISIDNNGKYIYEYPYGLYYVDYYNQREVKTRSIYRVYNTYEPHVIGWKEKPFEALKFPSGIIYEKVVDDDNFRRTKIEFLIFAEESDITISEIQWYLNRESLQDSNLVYKKLDNEMYGTLKWSGQNVLEIKNGDIIKNGESLCTLSDVYPVGSVLIGDVNLPPQSCGIWNKIKEDAGFGFWKRIE